MLRHWLVRNGQDVSCEIAYIKTTDAISKSQIEQVMDDVRARGWKFTDVYVIEKATSIAHKTLYQLILEIMRR